MPDLAEKRILIPSELPSLSSVAIASGREIHTFGGETMGTTWSVKTSLPPETSLAPIQSLIIQTLDTVVQKMSPWEPQSDLRRHQRAAIGDWVPFSPESFEVLTRSLEIAKLTNGIYDPTIAFAIDLLGFGPSPYQPHHPTSQPVRTALANCDYRQLQLDPSTRRVLQTGGIAIDLCSIAKGYAVDLIAERLEALDISNYFIEIGGEARGSGCKPNAEPWWCSIARPPNSETALPETLCAVCDLSIATSGNYLCYHIIDGAPIGHLVSPIKTESLEQELLSVSTFTDTCMNADAFASALYLMGAKNGLAFANHNNLAALFRLKTPTGYSEIESTQLAQLLS